MSAPASTSRWVVGLLFLFVPSSPPSLWAQVASSVTGDHQSNPHGELVSKVKAGDVDAMLSAGATGDRSFLPLLRQFWMTGKSPSHKAVWHARYATQAMAKLGDVAAQQSLWCWSGRKGDEAVKSLDNVVAFSYVAGWFGIRGLDVILTPEGEKEWYAWRAKQEPSDAPPLPPHVEALNRLAKLLPESPAGKDRLLAFKFTPREYALDMHKWIWDHQSELSKLEPTGAGVDFSPSACKNEKLVKELRKSK